VDLTVNSQPSEGLDVTGATTFEASSVTVGNSVTLTLNGSQLTGTTITGPGSVNLVGDVAAADVTPLLAADPALAGIVLTDATSLTGSAADLVDVLDDVTLDSGTDINITATSAASVDQAEQLADATNGTVSLNIQDDLTDVLAAAAQTTADAKNGLAVAGTVTVDDLDAGDEQVSFDNDQAAMAATTIDFTDGAATLSKSEFDEIVTDLSLTDADAITVTGVAAVDVLTVDAELAGTGTGADTIVVSDGETISLSSTDFQGLNATLAATTPGTGTDATLTVTGVANGESLTATDLVDTFEVDGLTVGQNAVIAGFEIGDGIDTGEVTLAARVDGSFASDGVFEFFVTNDGTNTSITYEVADDNNIVSDTATVTLTGVALDNTDFSNDAGVLTYVEVA